MAARSKARKRALDVLFESEVRGVTPDSTLEERVRAAEPPVNDYTVELVHGVSEQLTHLDELIETYALGWSLERMPAVDRNTLRIGIYEILYVDGVPDAVAISEAMNLVRDLSTDESPTFVNGVLGNILRNKAALSA